LVPVIRRKNNRLHAFSAVLFDYISNIETLITLGIGRLTERVLQQKSKAVSADFRGENNLNQIKCQVMSLLGFILEIGMFTYFITTRFERLEIITIGVVVQVFQYTGLIKNSVLSFSGSYFDLVKWATDFSSVESILNANTARNDFIDSDPSRWLQIDINNLHFHYLKQRGDELQEKNQVFRDLSFTLHRHEKIAVTGSSGAGKSTLFKILRELYQPDSVELQIDKSTFYNIDSIAPLVPLIPQTLELFENTIRYNIGIGSSITKHELDILIDTSCFAPVINRFSKGVESDIRGKGANLSGGERQRIALARGLYAARASSIIILDEVTSSIDVDTEMEVYRRIFDLYSDRCILVSVHRLYLLDRFDTVLSLNELSPVDCSGQIV